MANEKNLKKFNNLAEEKRKEIARKGGIASGKARREKKRIQDGFKLLNMQLENNSCNYSIVKTKDGIFLRNGQGYVMEYEQVKYICKELLKYAEKHKDDLIIHNDNTEEEYIKLFRGEKPTVVNNIEKSPSHIYLMECEGKYKIGVSKNVSRRMKELDRKPFKLNLITKSELLDDAYVIEKELHTEFEDYRINGEWFNLDEYQVEIVKKKIESLR